FVSRFCDRRDLHSFPTRRSSDLARALWDWWKTEPTIDVEAIDAIEAVTRHDVIAFLTWVAEQVGAHSGHDWARFMHQGMTSSDVDRKSTRLNSSHVKISYAVFCL